MIALCLLYIHAYSVASGALVCAFYGAVLVVFCAAGALTERWIGSDDRL